VTKKKPPTAQDAIRLLKTDRATYTEFRRSGKVVVDGHVFKRVEVQAAPRPMEPPPLWLCALLVLTGH